jgi:Holliday junction resolvasome RuvABC endonuclease subunit
VRILALDLSTRTGWALGSGERYESGVQAFDLKRGESPGMRYVRFRRWLEEVLPSVELVVYEQVVPAPAKFGGASARELAYNFAGRVQEVCALRGIEHTNVWPSSLKKWTTGKGNASKELMVAFVVAKWKPVRDDNEADAIALLHYAQAEIVAQARIQTPF